MISGTSFISREKQFSCAKYSSSVAHFGIQSKIARVLFLLCSITLQTSICFGNLQVMMGYVDMREARIWAGDDISGKVTCAYYMSGQKSPARILEYELKENELLCHTFTIGPLEPGTTYSCQVSNDRDESFNFQFTTQTHWQYRTDAPDFSFATGSCAFISDEAYDRPGKPYGGEYEIFTQITKQAPQFMLWLGDNVYLRETETSSMSGITYRYRHTRNQPEIKQLLTAVPNVAIWDDHDFGPNNSDASYFHKNLTGEAFRRFWANPGYGIEGGSNTCITSMFSWSDADFFLLDNRSHRTPPDIKGLSSPTMLGEAQITWLIHALKNSRAIFKFIAIGGQFLNSHPYSETYSTYPQERQRIIDLIDQNGIKGVVFLSGDRHCGELSKITTPAGIDVYDLTVSPLTSGSYDLTAEPNTLRVEGTVVPHRHFAKISVTGKKGQRQLNIKTILSDGSIKYEKNIPQP